MRTRDTGPSRKTCNSRTIAITKVAARDHSSAHSCKTGVGVKKAIQRTASAALPTKPASRNSFRRPQAIATPEISISENAISLELRIVSSEPQRREHEAHRHQ